MKKINVLYISDSLGLRHITRDLAIVDSLRKLLPQVEIERIAQKIISTLGTSVYYPDLPADGADKAAQQLLKLLAK